MTHVNVDVAALAQLSLFTCMDVPNTAEHTSVHPPPKSVIKNDKKVVCTNVINEQYRSSCQKTSSQTAPAIDKKKTKKNSILRARLNRLVLYMAKITCLVGVPMGDRGSPLPLSTTQTQRLLLTAASKRLNGQKLTLIASGDWLYITALDGAGTRTVRVKLIGSQWGCKKCVFGPHAFDMPVVDYVGCL